MIACNDYILLECVLYRIIKFHFAGHAAYTPLMDLFHEVGAGGGWGGGR
jgi:farnesyl diphosphate synthase